MKKGFTNEIKARVEAIEGMDIRDAAEQRYVTEQCSTRWLAAHWKVNNRTVLRILHELGIAVRHGGEAVATQWVGNLERRRKASVLLARTNHRLAQEDRHVRQGKTKENSELIRSISEKLKQTSAFLRPDVRAKCVSRSLQTRILHPERMSALREPLSESEVIMLHYLTGKSLEFETRKIFGFYVADFYIPSLHLVIDCQGRNRFPLSYVRHKRMAEEGVYVAYCVNDFIKRGVFADLDDYVSRVEASRRDPSVRCAEAVVFGACGHCPFGEDTDKFLVHRFGVRTQYYTELTAATHD